MEDQDAEEPDDFIISLTAQVSTFVPVPGKFVTLQMMVALLYLYEISTFQ